MTLLIITDSTDYTSDIVIRRVKTTVFRLNSDLIRDYTIDWTAEKLVLRSPAQEVCSSDITSVYWRKPFSSDEFSEATSNDNYFFSECRYLIREIYNFLVANGAHALVEAGAELRIGKIRQLGIARSYFELPSWNVILGLGRTAPINSIVKSLSGTPLDQCNVLYTSRVDGMSLDTSSVWLLQEAITNHADVTVCFLLGQIFAFEMVGDPDTTDWREHIFSLDEDSWKHIRLEPCIETKIELFMQECRLSFGRLDFIKGDEGLIFLEVNPNGQWAWLDPDDRYGLLSAMAQAIIGQVQ